MDERHSHVRLCEPGEVYPGIDVQLKATAGHTVEKLFAVQPGADPGQIRVRLRGGRGSR